MRIGLAGVGRIGAFHAETLLGVDGVDELVVSDLDVAAARVVADRRAREATTARCGVSPVRRRNA